MQMIQLLIGLLFSTLFMSHAVAECFQVEKIRDGDYPGAQTHEAFEITQPGRHCMKESITSHRVFIWTEGGEKSGNGSMGGIRVSGVSLDLLGRSVIAEAAGVSGIDSGNRLRQPLSNISVYNGSIRIRDGWAIQFIDPIKWDVDRPKKSFFQFSEKLPSLYDTEASEYQNFLTMRQALARDFPVTSHQVTGLNIDSSMRAIDIRGAGNRVIGNKIKVRDFFNGIYLSGPRQTIENNIIVVSTSPTEPHDGPIKLAMADDSVIRNNTIIIEGGGDNPGAAISIVGSKNVVIENNKIIGTKTLFKIWDEDADQKSNVIERGNTFEEPSLLQRIFRR